MDTPSRVASTAQRLGLAGLALALLGPLLIRAIGIPPLAGFYTFALGLLLGVIALALGLLGLLTTRASRGRPGRGRAWTGLAIGAGLLAGVVSINSGRLGAPPINDITTDFADPPRFVAIPAVEVDRDYSYDPGKFASIQRAAYPDLAPIALPGRTPVQTFADAKQAAQQLGWEIVSEDAESGRLEATQTTRVFRFVDDIVVRIRPTDIGSVLDVRSRSRDGRGDVGANAARIRAFRDALLQ